VAYGQIYSEDCVGERWAEIKLRICFFPIGPGNTEPEGRTGKEVEIEIGDVGSKATY
jgi:hypothetical protein